MKLRSLLLPGAVDYEGSGGVGTGGSAPTQIRLHCFGSGGVKTCGSSDQIQVFYSPSGGLVTGGAGLYKGKFVYKASGGVVTSGDAFAELVQLRFLTHTWNVLRKFQLDLQHDWNVNKTSYQLDLNHRWTVVEETFGSDLTHTWRILPDLITMFNSDDVMQPVASIEPS